jgi:hypothetical protein
MLTAYQVVGQELELRSDTIPVKPIQNDSSKVLKAGIGDTSRVITDSLPVQGSFETTVKYFAEDSIITDVISDITYLYGNAYIEYGRIKLSAERITIDQRINEVIAVGVQDSTGTWEGRPIFQDGGDTFETEEIRYNFLTQRARIIGVAAEQTDGYIRGSVVKRQPDNSTYIRDGKYTPCLNNPDATTYIKSKKIKVIPGAAVITGPFLLYVGGIPTPLGLPFGYFPDTQEATSGILFPKWGNEQRRGIFLRDGGYYKAWNDKIHTALTFDVYSKGSWAVRARNVYKKRYKFSGAFDLTYNRNITPEYEEQPLDSKDFWVNWSHRPESLGRNSRFSASLQGGTSTFNQNNLGSNSFQNNIRSEFRSNISYSGTIPRTPFSYSMSARHSQNIQTGIVDISLPDASVNMNRIFPFKRNDVEILKKLSVGWDLNLSNRVTNLVTPPSAGFPIVGRSTQTDTIAFAVNNINALLANAQNGARMRIPISTALPIFGGKLNLTPSVNAQEVWYLEELKHTWDPAENAVRIDTIAGFSRAGTMSASMSIGTQLFGIYTNKNPFAKTEAIRHIITPGVGFSYRPDYGQEQYGFYQDVQVDSLGNTRQVSIYDGFLYGSPQLGESAALSFQVSNRVEMKVRSDTAKSEKVSLIDNLSIGGSYNFLADSFNLSPISINLRTNLFDKKLSVNLGAVLDPYSYLQADSDGDRLVRRGIYAWQSGQGIGRITSGRASLSTNFNPRASGPPQGNLANADQIGNAAFLQNGEEFGDLNQGGELSRQLPAYFYDPNAYVDVNISWNLRMSYDFSYAWNPNSGATIRQAVKAFGQLALTPKWDITFNTGFDIEAKEFTQTSLGIYRDLGCWELRGNWIPFGAFTSYSIDIQIKASALKDLKLSRRRSQFDRF